MAGGAKVSEGGGTTRFSLPNSDQLKGLNDLMVDTSAEEPLLMVSYLINCYLIYCNFN